MLTLFSACDRYLPHTDKPVGNRQRSKQRGCPTFGQSKRVINPGIFNGHVTGPASDASPPPLSDRFLTMHTLTDDGTRLFLSRMGDRGSPPLILAHGTFSNQRSCAPLASHLAARGWQCWLFDWRGHGHSDTPRRSFDFETLAMQDVPAVLRAVEENCAPLRPFWLGHSAGAVIAAMWLARQAPACERLAGLQMLAAQASSRQRSWAMQQKIRLISCLLPLRRQIASHWMPLATEAESSRLLRQWCRWNLQGRMQGKDGFDYLAALGRQQLPVLALAGGGDDFISPADGCQRLLDSFGSTNKRYVLCSQAQGFVEDYSHERLLLSKNAKNEIWPLLENWLHQHMARSEPEPSSKQNSLLLTPTSRVTVLADSGSNGQHQ
ncbi:alpha/beta fold hydrolase [Aquitalea sp. ASV11]|uniref:alpha/beta fold hydrolase n=1 Tax=Aquitalea sp. ASV11 TaxID=2795103 RepID=UPI0018EE2B03|nr:alpha/beta fold hydrolase [Aquitalea sp. ASV11]